MSSCYEFEVQMEGPSRGIGIHDLMDNPSGVPGPVGLNFLKYDVVLSGCVFFE
jgi:hypothetical protein